MLVVGQDEVVDALGQFVAGGELATLEDALDCAAGLYLGDPKA